MLRVIANIWQGRRGWQKIETTNNERNTGGMLVSSPDPPSTLQEERGVWWRLAALVIAPPVLASLLQATLQTYLALQFTEAQQDTSKACEFHSNS